jgi:hypothetical protein
MGKSISASEGNSGEHVTAGRMPASPADSARDQTGLNDPTFTLRVKPDRRRGQTPINPDIDRRRSL